VADFQNSGVLPLDYGIELSWPEPRGGCKPLLTEKGVQLVEGVSVRDVEGCIHERNVLCEWRSALYVERVMRLGDEALNHIHAELEVALKRAEKGGLQRNTSQIGIHIPSGSLGLRA